VAVHESFLHKFWGVASFAAVKASNPRNFSPRKLYFLPICEGFLPQKFPTIWYSCNVKHIPLMIFMNRNDI